MKSNTRDYAKIAIGRISNTLVLYNAIVYDLFITNSRRGVYLPTTHIPGQYLPMSTSPPIRHAAMDLRTRSDIFRVVACIVCVVFAFLVCMPVTVHTFTKGNSNLLRNASSFNLANRRRVLFIFQIPCFLYVIVIT